MNLKKKETILYEREKELNPLALKWGFVCWAGSQIPILGLKIYKFFLSHFGTLFIILSFSILLFFYGPLLFYEARFQTVKLVQKKEKAKVSYFGKLAERQLEVVAEQVPDVNFSIVIPKIGAKAKIIENIDPADPKAYNTALKQGVAHAKGTFFPGMQGNITLFAHSTDSPVNISRFNAVFYLLRELESGDIVYIYFKGAKRSYRVYDKKTLEADDISYFKKIPGQEILILQTCWPPGTSLQRLLVFARPV